MSDPSPHFLDACVPMYAIGREHAYREPCARIVMAIAEGSLRVVTDTEVIQEIAYHYHAIGRRVQGVRVAKEFLEMVDDVLPVRREEAVHALELQHAHSFLLPRDAIHVAVMQTAGLTRIITADRHFERVPGIERVDPNDVSW